MNAQRKYYSLDDVKVVRIESIIDKSGNLQVIESGPGIGMNIQRVFWVSNVQSIRRGNHAHKECAQLLICIGGVCEVVCDDGVDTVHYVMSNEKEGVYIPPSIWAHQNYLEPDTRLLVLCSHHYSEQDYIREYGDFQQYRNLRCETT